MQNAFRLFPEQASTISGRVDLLYAFLVVVAVFFTTLICALILFFGIRYRRSARVRRGNPKQYLWVEAGWAAIPFVLTMVMFAWGAEVYLEIKSPPADALLIDVVGKQWMWKTMHPAGRTEINALHVPVGQPVRLRMISEDVIHSFYIPAFRVKQDVLPGYYTGLWFEPTRTGTFHLFCAEYCGTEHAQMRGTVTVMNQDDYADWLSGETGEAPEVAGERLFERHRCGTCHKPTGEGTGPSLVGLFGKQVPLKDGRVVTADEQYLRNSILNPQREIVAGYQPLMPTFAGQLNEAEVLKLIAYIKSLSAGRSEEEQPR